MLTKFYNRIKNKEKRRLLRKNMTKSEILLWQHLKNKKLGYKFRRQYGIGNYIIYFNCPNKKLVIEVDGITYDENKFEYDI